MHPFLNFINYAWLISQISSVLFLYSLFPHRYSLPGNILYIQFIYSHIYNNIIKDANFLVQLGVRKWFLYRCKLNVTVTPGSPSIITYLFYDYVSAKTVNKHLFKVLPGFLVIYVLSQGTLLVKINNFVYNCRLRPFLK